METMANLTTRLVSQTYLAKAALHGFALTLAREGAKHGINCNSIAPIAGSRITEGILPSNLFERLKPESISPFVAYLCHQSCSESGSLFELGGGYCGKLRIERSSGVLFRIEQPSFNPAAVESKFSEAVNFEKVTYPKNITDVNWFELVEKAILTGAGTDNDAFKFENEVVLITGAGGGLGKAYALMFGNLGCRVAVNDIDKLACNQVSDQIVSNGGIAISVPGDITDSILIVKKVFDHYGRVDILINNAGILRDKSFSKIADREWSDVISVHLKGTFLMTRAVWRIMKEQKYGRIINTSSAVGLYGNFGQANYSSAKAGIIGFSNSIAIEGKKYNILVNTICPNAGTQMTEVLFGSESAAKLKPEYVAPIVGFLAHRNNYESGSVFEAGSGWFSKVRWQRSAGAILGDETRPPTYEEVKISWNEITSFQGSNTYPDSPENSFKLMLSAKKIDSKESMSNVKTKATFKYSFKDVILYNLGIGFNEGNPEFVYENAPLKIFPSFFVIPAFTDMMKLDFGKLMHNFNPALLLHGEQFLAISESNIVEGAGGTLLTSSEVIECVEKEKGVVLTLQTIVSNNSGSPIAVAQSTTFNRGARSITKISKKEIYHVDSTIILEENIYLSTPFFTKKERIPSEQAVLYRLSGDYNPLHIDSNFAKLAGFDKPILHGLCTFGYAARHIYLGLLKNSGEDVKAIKVKFLVLGPFFFSRFSRRHHRDASLETIKSFLSIPGFYCREK